LGAGKPIYFCESNYSERHFLLYQVKRRKERLEDINGGGHVGLRKCIGWRTFRCRICRNEDMYSRRKGKEVGGQYWKRKSMLNHM
jgi:hypothetical protein